MTSNDHRAGSTFPDLSADPLPVEKTAPSPSSSFEDPSPPGAGCHEREREVFRLLTQAAVAESDLPEFYEQILSDLLRILDFDSATLRLYEPETRRLRLAALAGTRVRKMRDRFPSQRIDDPHYIAAFAARERQPVFAMDLRNHPIARTHAARIRELDLEGVIVYPIEDPAAGLVGVVTLNARHRRQISPGDRTFFEAVARMFGTIVAHRRAVDALRKSEAGYRSLFENAPAALLVEDYSGVKGFLNRLRETGVMDLAAHFKAHPQTVADCAARVRILDANRRAFELFQVSTTEAIAAGRARALTPRSVEVLAGELLAIDAGARQSTTEIEHLTLAGEKRQLVMQWFVAPGHESDYGRVLLSYLDVTETRDLENQLIQSQKMETVGTLAGGIAHDFNNIMQAISGYTQLMLWERDPGDPDYANLRAIEKAAERASKLTRQLLTFSRKVPSTLNPLNLNTEIENVVRILERTIPRMIRIECRLAPDIHLVNADRSQIEQVLMNLGINASSAMPGGGRLLFESRNVLLDRAGGRSPLETPQGPHVLVRVADTGHGMDAETRRRVFDPFFTTREIGQGSGLGLAMVYGIVKNHNGHILCESEPGKGASFRILLPAMPAEAIAGEKGAPPRESSPTGTETILVVDDEPFILDLAETALRRFGYGVMRAENGERALEMMAAASVPVRLVILDLSMPGMGGHDCLAALQARYPGVPVLVASGYAINGAAQESLPPGAAGFIGKPYRLRELVHLVRSLIDSADV